MQHRMKRRPIIWKKETNECTEAAVGYIHVSTGNVRSQQCAIMAQWYKSASKTTVTMRHQQHHTQKAEGAHLGETATAPGSPTPHGSSGKQQYYATV